MPRKKLPPTTPGKVLLEDPRGDTVAPMTLPPCRISCLELDGH